MDDGMEVWNTTKRGFGVYELSSIGQLFEFVESLQDSSRFVYRGQRDAFWKLETRIERRIPQRYKEIIGVEKLEWDMLYQFRRRAHHYLNAQDLPALNNLVEWLAVIQHYGGPTRLLDFTRSAFIGTYFALNDAIDVEEASLWAVNWQYMLMNLQLRLQSNWKDTDDLISRAMLDHSATTKFVVESLDGTNRLAASVIVAPYRQNRRLATQDGVFIVPLDINKPFTENLVEMFRPAPDFSVDSPKPFTEISEPDQHAVIKFVIRKANFPQFRKRLSEIGLRTELLFPDLEGEARSLEDIKTRHVFV